MCGGEERERKKLIYPKRVGFDGETLLTEQTMKTRSHVQNNGRQMKYYTTTLTGKKTCVLVVSGLIKTCLSWWFIVFKVRYSKFLYLLMTDE